jgi:hypothetical protein
MRMMISLVAFSKVLAVLLVAINAVRMRTIAAAPTPESPTMTMMTGCSTGIDDSYVDFIYDAVKI